MMSTTVSTTPSTMWTGQLIMSTVRSTMSTGQLMMSTVRSTMSTGQPMMSTVQSTMSTGQPMISTIPSTISTMSPTMSTGQSNFETSFSTMTSFSNIYNGLRRSFNFRNKRRQILRLFTAIAIQKLFRQRCRRRQKRKGSKRPGCKPIEKPPLPIPIFPSSKETLKEKQCGLLSNEKTSYHITNHAKNGHCLDCATYKIQIAKRKFRPKGVSNDIPIYNSKIHGEPIHGPAISSVPREKSSNLIRVGLKLKLSTKLINT